MPRRFWVPIFFGLLSCQEPLPLRGSDSRPAGHLSGELDLSPEPAPDPDALPEIKQASSARRVLQRVHGKERLVDVDAATAKGLTLVDLSDDFAPIIFRDGQSGDGTILPNRYRSVFVGLANDQCHGDGEPLPPHARNYLELYGVPPSFKVLRRRFLQDALRSCEGTVNPSILLAVNSITTYGQSTEKKEALKHRARWQRLLAAQEKAGVSSLEALAQHDPRYQREIQIHRQVEAERAAFAEAEKRLLCEGLLDSGRHTQGNYDAAMRSAVLNFQQKHAIHAQADLTRGTLEALARSRLVNNYMAFERSLTERVVHAGGFIEDGSAIWAMPSPGKGQSRANPTYKTTDGRVLPVPNLVSQALEEVHRRMGWDSPESVLDFFRRHSEEDFRSLRIVVRFPELPEYYGPHMNLVAEIDRGDIWYEFPFDEKGNRIPQPRSAYPSLRLFVLWLGDKVPLVSWRTTIGGWRREVASDGQEYYRFKDSDVGPRVWRHVVAAPVWLPPASSPLTSMVKTKYLAGGYSRVVNYDETGPGYLSAYGLVAGIHVNARKGSQGMMYSDNGIRTHGSFDYLSLRGRFSHGCHRLHNHLAVRLFSFVLAHRKVKVLGDIASGYRRIFYSDGEVFDLRLPSRGFFFELTPPLPIETLKGTILGTRQTPILGYVHKPGVVYAQRKKPTPPAELENRAGGDGPAESIRSQEDLPVEPVPEREEP